MPTRLEVVELARKWVGTPFQHAGRKMGVAVDCAGVISRTGKAAGLTTYDQLDYSSEPQPNKMMAVLDRHLVRIPFIDMRPADILWFAYNKEPQHLAIYTGKNIIHAYSPQGKCVETRFDLKWRKRVRAVYSYPGLD